MKSLKVIDKILKSILKYTRSLCKEAKTGSMWSRILVLFRHHAAEYRYCKYTVNVALQPTLIFIAN